MAITGVYTELVDTALGNPTANDSIAMLLCPAVAQSGTGGLNFAQNTLYLLNNLQDLTNLGVTQAGNPKLYFNVNEFYEQAGNGSKLWVVGYPIASEQSLVLSRDFPNYVRQSIATSFDNRPRFVGFVSDPARLNDTTTFIAPEAIRMAEYMNRALTTLFDESIRMCAVMDGIRLNSATAVGINAVQPNDIQNGSELNYPRIALQLTTSTPGMTASIGQTLGRMASIPLATSIGNGGLAAVSQLGYFLDAFETSYINTNVSEVPRAIFDALGERQYLFTRVRPQTIGVNYNDGATLNLSTNALSELRNVRVGNAVCDSVEAFFVKLINTNVDINLDGTINSGYKSATIDSLRQTYLQPRIARGEATEINVDFWALDGNFIRSRAIQVQVEILQSPTLRQVYILTYFVDQLD